MSTTLKELLKEPDNSSLYMKVNPNDYRELLQARRHPTTNKSERERAERLARSLIKRGLLKPKGRYNKDTDIVLTINKAVYSVPEKWGLAPQMKTSGAAKFFEARDQQCRRFIHESLPLRTVNEVRVTDYEPPVIKIPHSEDPNHRHLYRKRDKQTWVIVPPSLRAAIPYSTNEFIAIKRPDTWETVADIKVAQIQGWWRNKLQPGANYPVQAWIAMSGDLKTITRNAGTAVTAIKTRALNQVMKAIDHP